MTREQQGRRRLFWCSRRDDFSSWSGSNRGGFSACSAVGGRGGRRERGTAERSVAQVQQASCSMPPGGWVGVGLSGWRELGDVDWETRGA